MSIASFEPLLPSTDLLKSKATETVDRAERTGSGLHPDTRRAIIDLLRTVNCYYSNLIEGHDTHPVDIERAMRKEYSKGTAERNLQLEALAHIEVQSLVEKRVGDEPDVNPSSPGFLRWIHKEFYERTPEEFRVVGNPETGKAERITPGELRHFEVTVGRHLPPPHEELDSYLRRTSDVYDPSRYDRRDALIALSAANHRLLWVHPFGDGNGRVTRLMTDAYLRRIHIGGYGLWNVSRGLARRRKEYLSKLDAADSPRWDSYDGRGALSLKALDAFCDFFLDVCLDQVDYMREILRIDAFADRVVSYGRAREMGSLPGHSMVKPVPFRGQTTVLLKHFVYRGSIPRGEIPSILGVKERTSRRIVEALVAEGFLTSMTHRAPLFLRIPAHAAPYLIPQLYNPAA